MSTPALQAVDGSCKSSSKEIIPAEANSDPLGTKMMGKRFVLVQSELEHLLAKSNQLGRSRDQERCRHSVSGNRDDVQHWKCSTGNVEKVTAGKQGQHRRRCGQ